MVQSQIERWIDQACDQYRLSQPSKYLLKQYLHEIVDKVIQSIEEIAEERHQSSKYIQPYLVKLICQKILSNKSAIHDFTKNQEVYKEDFGNIEKDYSQNLEVV